MQEVGKFRECRDARVPGIGIRALEVRTVRLTAITTKVPGSKTAGPNCFSVLCYYCPPPDVFEVVDGGVVVGVGVAFVICSVVVSITELAVVSSDVSPVLVREVLE